MFFYKGYTPNWTAEIFRVRKIQFGNPITYLLHDLDGEEIKGTFYEEELQLAKFPDLYLIEKELKKKGKKVFVKWLGFDDTYNSWIDKSAIF